MKNRRSGARIKRRASPNVSVMGMAGLHVKIWAAPYFCYFEIRDQERTLSLIPVDYRLYKAKKQYYVQQFLKSRTEYRLFAFLWPMRICGKCGGLAVSHRDVRDEKSCDNINTTSFIFFPQILIFCPVYR